MGRQGSLCATFPLEEQVERPGGGPKLSPLPLARTVSPGVAKYPCELPARAARRRRVGDPIEPALEEPRRLVGRPEERDVGPQALRELLGDRFDEEEIAGGAQRERVGESERAGPVGCEPRCVAGVPFGLAAPAGRRTDHGFYRGIVVHIALPRRPPMAVDQPVAEHLHQEGPGVSTPPEALGSSEPFVTHGRVERGEHPGVERLGWVGLGASQHRRERAEAHLRMKCGAERRGEQDPQRGFFAAPEGAKERPDVGRRDWQCVHGSPESPSTRVRRALFVPEAKYRQVKSNI
jgi:hypothetical protein